jgi:hypothetical protein
MVVMVMVVMVHSGGKHRAGKHHQEQRCCKNLFHDGNLARQPAGGKGAEPSASTEEMSLPNCSGY